MLKSRQKGIHRSARCEKVHLTKMANNSYVVDIQGFHAPDFLPKEICIVNIHTDFVWHCVVRPPTCYNRLSPRLRKLVSYISKNIHGLDWDLGFIPEADALGVLRNILQGAVKVYIKGSERATYLRRLLNFSVNVVDLDIFDYRGQRELKENQYSSCSPYLLKHNKLRCAFRKACMYRDYIRKHLEKV